MQGPPNLALQKAAINWDRNKAMEIIEEYHPNAVRSHITFYLETLLHHVFITGERSLREEAFGEDDTPQDLERLVDRRGCTALHYAAEVDQQPGIKEPKCWSTKTRISLMSVCANLEIHSIMTITLQKLATREEPEPKPKSDLNIITYAILNGRERVFNLVHQTGWKYIYGVDNSLNNVLHLAARLGHEQQINLKASVTGVVLQMQREMQWFKEVKKLTPPSDGDKRNNDGLTPAEVFSDTHQDLVKEEEDFLYTLPKRLINSLITLFVFILSAMVAFGAILYLVFGDNKAWILIPIVALTSIPITLF
ncbi:hypothetical protein RHSIM_Rhsim05G0150600 [Rhododendron simsii]|uniref:PGG domain-containing protein n=1 Tax=Rhododendron simsii TaxID=118357 RepID=A0A834LN69_RHOSS|nr:hypothetical protein RHSIM_Rhsim05G0150600 [Rhododendron simsii]